MKADDPEIFKKVAEQLYKMTAPQYRVAPITTETEIYQDLGIYGDEIVEFVWWLEREFDVNTNVNPFRYTPRDGVASGILRLIRKIIGSKPHYDSLKVRDIMAVIEAKRWPDSEWLDDESPIMPVIKKAFGEA
jgi:hypothetical protein